MTLTLEIENARALELIRLLDQRYQLRGDPIRQAELQRTHEELNAFLRPFNKGAVSKKSEQ